jgi:hypothetical protein
MKVVVEHGGSMPSAAAKQEDPPGTGTAPPTAPHGGGTLLAVPGSARRVVYLIDRSISMGPSQGLDVARQEVLASLRNLRADTHFQIIAYNTVPESFRPGGLVPAEPALIEEAERFLLGLNAAGATKHLVALQKALLLRPELIFLVTDADDLTLADVRRVTYLNRDRGARIHVVELASAAPDRADSLLASLAESTGGTYRRVRPIP